MEEQPYTLSRWRVREGREAAFVAAWRRLAAFFLSLREPPRWGTRLFYSFGPWPSTETIAAVRAHPDTPPRIGRLTDPSEEAEFGTFRVAAAAGARQARD